MKHRFDLNLYRFLTSLSRHSSQSKVCHELEISRATFNRHLSECRDCFGNELFVVNKGVYTPTLFTKQLIEYIQSPLEVLEHTQQASHGFDHADKSLEFFFYVVNPLSRLVTIPLVEGLQAANSNSKISFVDWSLDGVEFPKPDTLSVGIAGYPNDFNDQVLERKVGSLGLYVYVNKQSSLANVEHIELSSLVEEKNVRVSMGAFDSSTYYERVRKSAGIALKQELTVASLGSAMDCVARAGYVFVCFDVGAEASSDVVKVPLLLNGEQLKYDVGIHYHRVNYQHPVMNKIEQLIRQAMKSM